MNDKSNKQIQKARQFCQKVKKLAQKYNLPFFVVTDAYEVFGVE